MSQLAIARSLRTKAWGFLRHSIEPRFGRARLWNWLWDREWQSLKRDRRRAEAKKLHAARGRSW